jgi:hypothetical protein
MSEVVYTSKPVGGSALDNSTPNANYTRARLAQWMEENPLNALDFAVQRNPTTVYRFIRLNYGDAYPLLKNGAQATLGQMENMKSFLERQYNNLKPEQRAHFIANILHSLPKAAELQNWTTPVN